MAQRANVPRHPASTRPGAGPGQRPVNAAPGPAALIDEREAARRLGVAASTLKRWRLEGAPQAPAHVTIGQRTVRYRAAEIDALAGIEAPASAPLALEPGACYAVSGTLSVDPDGGGVVLRLERIGAPRRG